MPLTATSAPWAKADWEAPGQGFTLLSDYTGHALQLQPDHPDVVGGHPGGSGNRIVLQLDPGNTLNADDYRVYIPNQVEPNGLDTRITDIYGNQLDGENLGDQTSTPSPDFPSLPNYEDLQSSGVYRQDDMSGDGVAGGAFMAGFTVVNYGNIIYTRPDYVENPLLPSSLSDGWLAKPYPVLAPEGDPLTAPANPSHNPNGGLNSTFFYQPGNFNTRMTSAATATSSSRHFTRRRSSLMPRNTRRAARSSSWRSRAFRSETRSRPGHAGQLRAPGPRGQQQRRDQRQCFGAFQYHA